MAKKHRVKRQKQVEYLLRLERERDAYLEKRKNAKRNRKMRNEGDVFGDARDDLVAGDAKRRRRELVEGGAPPVVSHVKGEKDDGSSNSTSKGKVEDTSAATPKEKPAVKSLKKRY